MLSVSYQPLCWEETRLLCFYRAHGCRGHQLPNSWSTTGNETEINKISTFLYFYQTTQGSFDENWAAVPSAVQSKYQFIKRLNCPIDLSPILHGKSLHLWCAHNKVARSFTIMFMLTLWSWSGSQWVWSCLKSQITTGLSDQASPKNTQKMKRYTETQINVTSTDWNNTDDAF